MKDIKFSDYKDQIITSLKDKGKNLWINEPVTLVDGFINQPIDTVLNGSFNIWGPSIPMILLVWDTTWRMYHFALKAILPNIDI